MIYDGFKVSKGFPGLDSMIIWSYLWMKKSQLGKLAQQKWQPASPRAQLALGHIKRAFLLLSTLLNWTARIHTPAAAATLLQSTP